MKTLYSIFLFSFLFPVFLFGQNGYNIHFYGGGGWLGANSVLLTGESETAEIRGLSLLAGTRIETARKVWSFGVSAEITNQRITLIDNDISAIIPTSTQAKSIFSNKSLSVYPFLKRSFSPYRSYIQLGVGGGYFFNEKFNKVIPSRDDVFKNNIYNTKRFAPVVFAEAGIDLSEKITISLRYSQCFSDVVKGDYMKYQSSNLVLHQQFTSNMPNISLNAHYKIGISTQKDNKKKLYRPPVIKNIVRVDNIIEVKNRDIVVSIFDDKEEDGDILTLVINDTPQKKDADKVIEKYELKNQKKDIDIQLQSITSFLIMHSISEGKVPPNTAAIIIDDGVNKKQLTLKSTRNTSGAILLHYTDTTKLEKPNNPLGSWISDKHVMTIKNEKNYLLVNHSAEKNWKNYYSLSENIYKCEDGSNTIAIFDNHTIRLDSINGTVRFYELNPTGIWQYGEINVYVKNARKGILAQNQGHFFWKGFERIDTNTYYRDGKIITVLNQNKIHLLFPDGTERYMQKVIVRTE